MSPIVTNTSRLATKSKKIQTKINIILKFHFTTQQQYNNNMKIVGLDSLFITYNLIVINNNIIINAFILLCYKVRGVICFILHNKIYFNC